MILDSPDVKWLIAKKPKGTANLLITDFVEQNLIGSGGDLTKLWPEEMEETTGDMMLRSIFGVLHKATSATQD